MKYGIQHIALHLSSGVHVVETTGWKPGVYHYPKFIIRYLNLVKFLMMSVLAGGVAFGLSAIRRALRISMRNAGLSNTCQRRKGIFRKFNYTIIKIT